MLTNVFKVPEQNSPFAPLTGSVGRPAAVHQQHRQLAFSSTTSTKSALQMPSGGEPAGAKFHPILDTKLAKNGC